MRGTAGDVAAECMDSSQIMNSSTDVDQQRDLSQGCALTGLAEDVHIPL